MSSDTTVVNETYQEVQERYDVDVIWDCAPMNKVSFILKLEKLKDNDYAISKNIEVFVEYNDDGYTAYYKPLNLYGFGGNYLKAIEDLEYELLDLHDELVSTPNKDLGAELKKQKQLLTGLIVNS